MMKKEWEVIRKLVDIGLSESPWAWADAWPKDVHREETEQIISKLDVFLSQIE